MLISVLDDFGTEIFRGEAEEFLFEKENNIELEILLDKLESMPYNSVIKIENLKI